MHSKDLKVQGSFYFWHRLEPYSMVEQKQTIPKMYGTYFLYSNCIHDIVE